MGALAQTILTEGVQAYYESQLASLPGKDGTWPKAACDSWSFDPHTIPRLAGELAHA